MHTAANLSFAKKYAAGGMSMLLKTANQATIKTIVNAEPKQQSKQFTQFNKGNCNRAPKQCNQHPCIQNQIR